MTAEKTERKETKGWILYDGNCALCIDLAGRFKGILARRGFELLPLQTRGAGERLGLSDAELLAEMRLLLPDGKVFGGADAVVEVSGRVWWAWPFYMIGQMPAVRPLIRAAYRWIARRRGCDGGRCEIANARKVEVERRTSRALGFLPLLILPLLALVSADRLPAWVFMWAMAFALYAGCKWLTYWEARRRGVSTTWLRACGYLLAWPGMDAATFLRADSRSPKPRKTEWFLAAIKTLLGAILIWVIARTVVTVNPLLIGWVGMAGVVFLLHFGVFHLLSLVWRNMGVNAAPLMRAPMLACSLGEFWGKRWNTAFHELVHRFTFRPLRRVANVTGATLLVFLLSGLVHELVISFPARDGYGLPTAYFIVQGMGVLAQHSRLGRRIGLGRGWRGWLFTVVITVGPVLCLFHPPFIKNVILPMLQFIGAT